MVNKRCVASRPGILSHLLFILIEGQGWNQFIERLQRRSNFLFQNSQQKG